MRQKNYTVVAVSGHFDPPHIGHLRHIQKARKLGDWLIAIVSSDKHCVAKKGICLMPQHDRMEIVKTWVDEVFLNIDYDGTSTQSLKVLKPNIFAKGGDRIASNMPQNEIDICKKIGCKIVYNVGGQLHSSTYIVNRIKEWYKEKYLGGNK